MQRDYLADYKYSRHKVQLVDASLVEAHIEKIVNVVEGNHKNNIDLQMKIDNEDGCYFGFLKVELSSQNVETERLSFKITVIYKGQFRGDGIDGVDITEAIKNQLVAQLYPFVRSAVTTISAFMNVPTVILPTIDIVNTLAINDSRE